MNMIKYDKCLNFLTDLFWILYSKMELIHHYLRELKGFSFMNLETWLQFVSNWATHGNPMFKCNIWTVDNYLCRPSATTHTAQRDRKKLAACSFFDLTQFNTHTHKLTYFYPCENILHSVARTPNYNHSCLALTLTQKLPVFSTDTGDPRRSSWCALGTAMRPSHMWQEPTLARDIGHPEADTTP